MEWKKSIIVIFLYFFFFSSYAFFSSTSASSSGSTLQEITSSPLISATADSLHHHDFGRTNSEKEIAMKNVEVFGWTSRRLLVEPKSSPPNCASKCGTCTPCDPVLVSVPPVTAEYYPVVWKCQCGGKLYDP